MSKRFWFKMMLLEHHFKIRVDPDDRGWLLLDDLNAWLSDRWYGAVLREDKEKATA